MQFLQSWIVFVYTIIYIGIVRGFQRASGLNKKAEPASSHTSFDSWTCKMCGTDNDGNFCKVCGAKRP